MYYSREEIMKELSWAIAKVVDLIPMDQVIKEV